jgi:hypothetical protein
MAAKRRDWLIGLMLTELVVVGSPALAAPQVASDRVRGSDAAIATLINHASERSNTFRGLVNTINASDGMVYVEPGACEHGMQACLVNVTMAGPTRIVWVKLHTQGDECDLMGLIGHELQHTIEVLGNRQVTSSGALYFFLSQEADAGISPAFETDAAKRIGETVRTEVRHNNRCTRVR